MADSSLKRQLKVITIPVFIEIALVMLLGAVDTVMLSRYSDNSVAAVGLDNQLISLVFLVYQFFSMGAAILCAQYIGAGLRKQLIQVVGIALVVNLLLGLTVSALLYFFAEELLVLMGLRPELMGDGVIYLRLTGALSFFQALSLTFSASLRSADKVVWPMAVTGLVNVLNIVGNYALIFGHWGFPQLGVEGAAISTSVCRAVSMLILAIVHFRVHIPSFPLHYFRPMPWHELKNLMKIGIPAMSENISYSLSQVVITYFINQISNEALAARTYCANMIMFVYLFCISITQGGDILVGHLVGQWRHQAAYVLGNYFFRWSLIITLTGSVLLAIAGPSILDAFTDNEEIIRMGVYGRYGLSLRGGCDFPMECCCGTELFHRYSAGLWSGGYVGRFCPRREYPWCDTDATLAFRKVAYKGVRKKRVQRANSLNLFLRKVRDSNPRYPKGVYRISSPARSITLPTFRLTINVFLEIGCKVNTFF